VVRDGNNVTVSVHAASLAYASVVGGYFVALGIIGEGIKYFNVPFGKYVTIFLSFAGGIALFTGFLSETLRRSVMVFLSKHMFEHKHV
jgi:hypothetical protein